MPPRAMSCPTVGKIRLLLESLQRIDVLEEFLSRGLHSLFLQLVPQFRRSPSQSLEPIREEADTARSSSGLHSVPLLPLPLNRYRTHSGSTGRGFLPQDHSRRKHSGAWTP